MMYNDSEVIKMTDLMIAKRSYTEHPDTELFQMHTHDGYEVFCFLRGKAKYFVEGTVYPLRAGDILAMKKAESHTLLLLKDQPYERITIHFPACAIEGSRREKIMSFLNDRHLGKNNRFSAALFKGNNWLYYLNSICEANDEETRRLYLTVVLSELCDSFDKIRPDAEARDNMSDVIHYINSHLSDELSLDSSRIGLGGDSAGASLAALVSHRYEQERLLRPCLQMLVYPMTDAEMQTDSMKEFTDTPMWNARFTEKMWTYYCDDPGEKYSASPMHCELPGSIPDTYIETAQFDCLHDEGILYAQKLKEAGAYVELYDTKGTYHGYDVAIDAQIVQDQIAKRVAFLKRGFCYEV
jgi:mannose-6-phosphate isomerase-like protein (cupin superfamily)